MRTVCAPTFVGAPGGSSARGAESGSDASSSGRPGICGPPPDSAGCASCCAVPQVATQVPRLAGLVVVLSLSSFMDTVSEVDVDLVVVSRIGVPVQNQRASASS